MHNIDITFLHFNISRYSGSAPAILKVVGSWPFLLFGITMSENLTCLWFELNLLCIIPFIEKQIIVKYRREVGIYGTCSYG